MSHHLVNLGATPLHVCRAIIYYQNLENWESNRDYKFQIGLNYIYSSWTFKFVFKKFLIDPLTFNSMFKILLNFKNV